MIRGTTPELSFTLPFSASSATRIWITFSQNNQEVFTVEKPDCTIEENVIKFTLSQKQTLSLNSNSNVEMQIRILFPGEKESDALASNIITTTVQRILKDGEI